jgi:glycosyltransferase involved in cell wall biosynthesis
LKSIAIIYRYIPRYRQEFYNLLRNRLSQDHIELLLIHGQPGPFDSQKRDAINLDWSIEEPSKIFEFAKHEIYWQPVFRHLKNVDLVIVEQASKLLVNYLLLIKNALGMTKLAFWGHGKNFQATSQNKLGEWIKRQVSTHVHWWFAYNQLSAHIVREMGFPDERITVVQNAIDTRSLIHALKHLPEKHIQRVKKELNISSENIAIYIGGMYPEKRLPFLLAALKEVKKEIPDFSMIFIGGGVCADQVEKVSEQHVWIHFLGSKFSEEIVPYFSLSKLLLIPGSVGLAVLDSFALETPLVTTKDPNHGPEISYLENGYNGLIIPETEDPKDYAMGVIELLKESEKLNKLVEGCRASRDMYTIEAMVENFANGIVGALNTPLKE